MKLNRFGIVTLMAISLGFLSVTSNAGEIKERTYTFKAGGEFSCYGGVAPNGHNYPTATVISFQTDGGTYYPNKIPLTNVSEARFQDVSAKPCADFNDLLKTSFYSLDGTATQKFSTSLRRVAGGECFKFIREDLTIAIKGYVFKGSNVMAVPMDSSDCLLHPTPRT